MNMAQSHLSCYLLLLETRKTQKDVMSLDVTKCHICDIAWLIHKLISWNGLDLELKSNVTDFREKRILL